MDNKLVDGIRAAIAEHPYDAGAYADLVSAYDNLIKSGDTAWHGENKALRGQLSGVMHAVREKGGTAADLKRLNDAYWHSALVDAPVDFDAYCLYIEKSRDQKKRFYAPRRKQLLPVVNDLQDLMDDKLDILGISLPPGVGKTTLAIFLLTWVAGRWPDEPNLTGSHSNAFVHGVYEECLRLIDKNGEYLWHDVFPDVQISGTNAKDYRIDLGKRKRFETLEFTSIGSGNAGLYRAGKLLYCDDLVSGLEIALSKDRLDKLWDT